MPVFVDLCTDEAMLESLWAAGTHRTTRSPLDAINDGQWHDEWIPGNEEEFGNWDIAASDQEDQEPPFAPG